MPAAPDLVFTDSEKTVLLGFARATLEACLDEVEGPLLAAFLDESPAEAPWRRNYPCFVSLFTRSGRLRGCIGCTETDVSLAANVLRFARLAALKDPRFRPVEPHELANLRMRISVLGPSKPLPSLDDLVIGRHGLSVFLKPWRGVLLAEVATQYGWSKERFLHETLVKAGIPPSELDRTDVFYFEEIEFSEKE